MGRGMKGRGVPEKAKDFKGTFRKLINYIGKYKIAIIIVMIFAVASTIFGIVGPKILGNATTVLFEGIMNMISDNGLGIDFKKIGNIILTLVVIYLISALFSYIQNWIMTGITQKITYKLRKEISEKITRLPLKYFDKKSQGEVLSYITNDIDTLSQSLNEGLAQVITAITTLIGIIVMMLTISVKMTVAAILVLPVALFLVMLVIKRSQKYFVKRQEFLGKMNGHIEEIYTNHNIVKAFSGEKKSSEKFEKYNKELYNASWKSQFLSGLMPPIMNFVNNLGYVMVCILGGYYASTGTITIGNIQSFIQYMRNFTQPVSTIANLSSELQATMASCERVFELLEEEEEVKDVENPKTIDDIKGIVEFRNVKFGYNDDKIVINNFNAQVKEGQKIAIVGPTGAGKTTIVKLLMRFYDVNDGEILLDGINIKDFTRHDLRKVFGMVLQDTWVFNGTFMENIRYGKLDATDEEVIEAAKKADAHHFIKTLEKGYNTVLNEDSSNISQGQKQLLTIARAFLANPKILILDEATSSVDTRTEIIIQNAMNELLKGRTSFVIAHRLSTIRNADLILVMNNGDIVEQGTHEELLAKKGFYEKLYNSQFDEEEE